MARHNGLVVCASSFSTIDKQYSQFEQNFKLLYLINDNQDLFENSLDYLLNKDPNWNRYTIIQTPTPVKDHKVEYVFEFHEVVSKPELTNKDINFYMIIDSTIINSIENWHKFNKFKRKFKDYSLALKLSNEDDQINKQYLDLWLTEAISFIYVPNKIKSFEFFKIFQFKSIPIPLLIMENAKDHEQVCLIKSQHRASPQFYLKPLQPLVENLSIGIYKQFEKDQTKYNQFAEAFELAINDLLLKKIPTIKILLIGPGNGKLLTKLWNIIKTNLDKFEIDAIEKNPICIGDLKDKNKKLWKSKIQLVEDDLRNLPGSEGDYNLVISELLGSFGDNELCPEILAQFNQPKPDLIMIPGDYTSYLQPIFTPVKLNTIALIKLTNYYPNSDPQPVWEWQHPEPHFQSTKSKKLTFINRYGYKVSGFLGWFNCTLYGHINIQIHDDQAKDYCKSWFPIYFPVKPKHVKPGDNLVVEFHRKKRDDLIWYEYEFQGKLYNQNGCDYLMHLS
ncbi:uncharacterized protein J8A68_002209 [[Candida] subhashii]|uniref:Protein arginine N-methyltransferase n=1 Tax=[Candida] subhashii TaxID=561895 RepID=A0A8J5V1B9_9ASCO|nr:uncharacterized protein J8A68_002209 [[Candida] subhashii]KAG7664294.1 hypothetical protein J8A68_002209 [[Candida] subhashii]